jgi:hypothetical protein
MDMMRYDSLNEKLGLCYKCLYDLKKYNLTKKDIVEIEQEAEEYRTEMNQLLLEVE